MSERPELPVWLRGDAPRQALHQASQDRLVWIEGQRLAQRGARALAVALLQARDPQERQGRRALGRWHGGRAVNDLLQQVRGRVRAVGLEEPLGELDTCFGIEWFQLYGSGIAGLGICPTNLRRAHVAQGGEDVTVVRDDRPGRQELPLRVVQTCEARVQGGGEAVQSKA